MALMTSSSVTSSAVPRKEVSRRSMRMARSLSALPRRALMRARRSVSLRGRKSLVRLLTSIKGLETVSLRSWAGRSTLGRGRQFRQQQVDAAVKAGVGVVHFVHFAALDDVKAHFLGPYQHPDGVAGGRQGDRQHQAGAELVLDDLEADAGLLTTETVDTGGVLLQSRPKRVQRPCQIRAVRDLDGQRAVAAVAFGQGVP